MTTNQCDIGLIGLAVMGENLALNMESKGFSVAVFNRTTEVTEKFAAERGKDKNIQPTRTMGEFVGALKKPRKAMIMVKAGAPVDAVINQLAPLLEKGDVIIDGGNPLCSDTQRRGKELDDLGIHFVGCGVSGGEEGALKGPSLMPGGSRESWEMIAPIFRKIAAQVDGEPCCRYMGPDGAGHYVKMVHNGIEYGDMQLICEAYAILNDVAEMNAPQLAETFTEWNKGDRTQLVESVRNALYASKIVSYAQGMELLGAASGQYKWNLNFGDIATIWRGGCIIRAIFLNRIVEAYERNPALHNLLLDHYFTDIIAQTQDNWRVAVSTAVEQGVAVPAFGASISYF